MAEIALADTGMYKDVMAQPACWDRLLSQDLGAFAAAVRAARAGVLVGMGSSHFAARAAQFALMRHGAIWTPVTADAARYYLPWAPPTGTVLAISQSGESVDTLAAAARLASGATTMLTITNTPGSRLATLGKPTIDLGCGAEQGSSTKTYTTTVLSLLLAAGSPGPQWPHLVHSAQEILETFGPDDAPALLGGDRRHYFLGAGPNVATALEAALISKEKLFLHAEGDGAAEFIHGPLEALDESCTVWLFSTNERLDDLLLPLARRIVQTGAQLVVIGESVTSYSAAGLTPAWTYPIELAGPSEFGTLLFILPIQLLVLYETARRGYPVDTFRRMDKVMTGYDYGLSDG